MKKFLIALMMVLMLSSMVLAITMNDLDIQEKMTTEEYLIENFDDITQMNVDDLEGEGYEILAVGDKWVIIVVDGEIFVILK